MTVPRGSTVLNVLEHSNVLYPVFNGFKVLYIANSSYYLISLNNDSDTMSCQWILSTNPAMINIQGDAMEGSGGACAGASVGKGPSASGYGGILSKALNSLYVSNLGMSLKLSFQSMADGDSGGKYQRSVNNKGKVSTRNNLCLNVCLFRIMQNVPHLKDAKNGHIVIKYKLVYTPKQCPAYDTQSSSTPLTLSIPAGSSALNVMEAAANQEPAHHFILKNIFGKFYIIESIGGSSTTGCTWCGYFSPSSVAPAYLLTADINNFIIPLSGGTLTMKYETSCGTLYENFSRGLSIPIPPHYNPLVGSSTPQQCEGEGESGAKGYNNKQ